MGKISRRFEEIFSAAAFAEAGEFETARELSKGSRKVLLVMTGKDSDRRSFTFAMNVAKRTGADIELLNVSYGRPADRFLAEFESRLRSEGLRYNVMGTSGCIKTKILEHASRRSDIEVVVVESDDVLSADCRQENGSLRGVLRALRCPLVLISELESA